MRIIRSIDSSFAAIVIMSVLAMPLLNGCNPLHEACETGDINKVKLLIDKKENVNARRDGIDTPLDIALKKDNNDIAELLINNGADCNSSNLQGYAPLLLTSERGNLKIAQLLLERGAAVNAATKWGDTSLTLACQKGYLQIAQLLLEHNASINTADNNDCTPLYLASANGHTEIAQLLLERGAEIDNKSDDRYTPLCIAAEKGHLEIARLLLNHEANVNGAGNEAMTPLRAATASGHIEIVKLLIEKGADIEKEDKNGVTVLHLAAVLKQEEIFEVFLDRGVRPSKSSIIPLMNGMAYFETAKYYNKRNQKELAVQYYMDAYEEFDKGFEQCRNTAEVISFKEIKAAIMGFLAEIVVSTTVYTASNRTYMYNSPSSNNYDAAKVSGAPDKPYKIMENDYVKMKKECESSLSGLGYRDIAKTIEEKFTIICRLVLEIKESAIQDASFSPDEAKIATFHTKPFKKDSVKIWDSSNGTLTATITTNDDSMDGDIIYDKTGKLLAFGKDGFGVKEEIEIWEIAKEPQKTNGIHMPSSFLTVHDIAFSPDGRLIISANDDGTLRIWETESGKLLRTLEGHKNGVFCVDFSPDGKYIASGSWDQTVRIWHADTATENTVLHGATSTVESLMFSPDGNYLAACEELDSTVMVWQTSTQRLIFLKKLDSSRRLHFSPDGKYIAVGTAYGKVFIIRTDCGRVCAKIDLENKVNAVDFSANGKYLLTATLSNIQVWEVEYPRNITKE